MAETRMYKISDVVIKDLVLKMDSALRSNTSVQNGKFVITNQMDWIRMSKNGIPFAEKSEVTTTKGNKVRVQTFLPNLAKSKPSTSYAHLWYKDTNGKERQSKNSIVICDTKNGRSAYLRKTYTGIKLVGELAPF